MTIADAKSPARPQLPVAPQTAADREESNLVELHGETYYRIGQFDELPPFLMTLTGESDCWMYVSSTGGLTAGRRSEDQAIFPYETDDKLHLSRGITGPVTMIRVGGTETHATLWEPFGRPKTAGAVRTLYKTELGDRIIFEERLPEHGLTYRYRWASSDALGFVRTCWLEVDASARPVDVEVIDGMLNILPGGIGLSAQQNYSCLINAYTQAELEGMLGIFAMSSVLADKPEPAEALTANTAWCHGLPGARYSLRADAIDAFRDGQPGTPVTFSTGRRGAYVVRASMRLESARPQRWDMVLDANRDQARVVQVRRMLRDPDGLRERIDKSLSDSGRRLRQLVDSADGRQVSNDRVAAAHHAANVLFNIMRGGVFIDGQNIGRDDFAAFLRRRNRDVAQRCATVVESLPVRLPVGQLLRAADEANDGDLLRLAYEYLPLTFSRRHGDPSRPWNRFSIRVHSDDGSPAIAYQGNWRDIFQNWEALAGSFPEFIESMIVKFLNASTLDGFNPYRITHEGIDWEVPDPGNPWSNIGYWGDHQIVYLLKLLEASRRCHAGRLEMLLARPMFCFADVPYRIRPYPQILQDPKTTIDFDQEAHRRSAARAAMGSDGRLVHGEDGRILKATLIEKLLIQILSKLSNLVADAGIWLNTQRPEWNDANNALVGFGVSMVTLCYLRRHVAFLLELLKNHDASNPQIHASVIEWFLQIRRALQSHESALGGSFSDVQRKELLDQLGGAFCDYRSAVYAGRFGPCRELTWEEIRTFLGLALKYLDQAIRANRRDDGLYHSYNLLVVSRDGRRASIQTMHEMLEGHVAVLSSGVLSAAQADEVLCALFASSMWRPDQNSFMLYPARRLPMFLDKNRVPTDKVLANLLLVRLLESGDRTVIVRDDEDTYRFAAHHSNAGSIERTLQKLAEDAAWTALVSEHRQAVLDLHEEVFHHRSFTGRSGAMYGYEGIGCIYWHMVAKLLLAVQECYFAALDRGAPTVQTDALRSHYRRIRGGLGFGKSAREYGAFPTDPYSHTPLHAGAQQPGMTGQVKEEILCRWGELGVRVHDGRLAFRPTLLDRNELLKAPAQLDFIDSEGRSRRVALAPGQLAFTFCGTPIIYSEGKAPGIRLVAADGPERIIEGSQLDAGATASLLARNGAFSRIEVTTELD